jgi:hypothetical protein
VLLLVASAAVATAAPHDAEPALRLEGEPPREATVAVRTDDPWEQAWTIYRLRDVRVSVERPTYLLTEQGPLRDAAAYRQRPLTHEAEIAEDRIRIRPSAQ